MGLPMGIIFALSLVLLRFFFRKELKQEQQQEKESDIHQLLERNEAAVIKDKNMLIKSLIVLVGVIILFSLQGITHIEVSIVAIGAAAVLLVITRAQLERILHEVDWPTLFFFVGLFVIVGVAQHAGLINVLAKIAINLTGESMAYICR
jgi:Na+/H+ antiporter NhaD/arsenite permease-like protein